MVFFCISKNASFLRLFFPPRSTGVHFSSTLGVSWSSCCGRERDKHHIKSQADTGPASAASRPAPSPFVVRSMPPHNNQILNHHHHNVRCVHAGMYHRYAA